MTTGLTAISMTLPRHCERSEAIQPRRKGLLNHLDCHALRARSDERNEARNDTGVGRSGFIPTEINKMNGGGN